MKFDIVKELELDDGSIRIIVETEETDLLYLGYFLETLEGWCNYTTISKKPTLISIDTNSFYLKDLKKFLEILKIWEHKN